jgi:hypothetical protein
MKTLLTVAAMFLAGCGFFLSPEQNRAVFEAAQGYSRGQAAYEARHPQVTIRHEGTQPSAGVSAYTVLGNVRCSTW